MAMYRVWEVNEGKDTADPPIHESEYTYHMSKRLAPLLVSMAVKI